MPIFLKAATCFDNFITEQLYDKNDLIAQDDWITRCTMIISFFSTVLNGHQIEFCDEMFKRYEDNFHFISCIPLSEERKRMFFQDYDRSYKICMYESEKNKSVCERLFLASDIVITGMSFPKLLKKRMQKNKITFLYRERLFKEKPSVYYFLKGKLSLLKQFWGYKNKRLYFLAASYYVKKDYCFLGMFKDKVFSWGYFPFLKKYDDVEKQKKRDTNSVSLLWVGRLIEWKKPLYIICVAKALLHFNILFHIHLIGDGVLHDTIQEEIKNNHLENHITLWGFLNANDVRNQMEQSDIFLFTSNREEGYGAVLYEAMNSRCAVIASETAGSTNLLIRDNINGLIYKNDSVDELCRKVIMLANNRDKINELGKNAYYSIISKNNAYVASKRFSETIDLIMSSKSLKKYDDGPMSLL